MPIRKSQQTDETSIWIVDQVDGEWVSVEIDASMKQFPRSMFPLAVKDGDVFRVTIDGTERTQDRSVLSIERDTQEQERLIALSRKQIERAKSTKRRDPGGDIQL